MSFVDVLDPALMLIKRVNADRQEFHVAPGELVRYRIGVAAAGWTAHDRGHDGFRTDRELVRRPCTQQFPIDMPPRSARATSRTLWFLPFEVAARGRAWAALTPLRVRAVGGLAGPSPPLGWRSMADVAAPIIDPGRNGPVAQHLLQFARFDEHALFPGALPTAEDQPERPQPPEQQ